ncbi:hypothetical protein BJ878DRAFT_111427 [Calycina marina]|uniref:DNA-directed RNA polymerase subunit n=1 Tax=Calycina marina TaxID=1763456 RepID=A0A9P7Z9K3_9HELO|nr:hypothetical protein BJ878DRAFT_111427 [Calycina marina]
MKAQVEDKIPKRFKELKFGIQSNQQIVNQAVLEVSTRNLYDIDRNRAPFANGALDSRMGTSSKTGTCTTCQEGLQNCNGHFGHVRLALPAFHIGYLKLTMNILQNICKDCAKVLLTEAERRSFLQQLRVEGIDNLKRTQICKKINEQCRKAKTCPHCESINGQIRKVSVIKLVHDKFVTYNKSNAKSKTKPEEYVEFEKSFDAAKQNNNELEKHLKKAMEDLSPLRVLNLFKMITPADCELLGINPAEGRPEMFLWEFIPAPPICIRPSVAQDNASTEDDITAKLADIVHLNTLIKGALQRGQPLQGIMDHWEFLQIQIAMYVNSDVPGLQNAAYGKPIRGFCQRLKGKQGRFRGNLSGKRVDFSGRTVISPDPNLGIDQVAIPILVAKNLTYPERVQQWNIEKLRKCVRNGVNVHPGANQIIKAGAGHKISLRFAKRDREADNLKYGDIVERHLEDDDIVLFNRQPSLHKLSIMSHYVKVRPWRTFRLNECVCTPYNADFDGDEMNLHVPQTEEARTEAINLMGVKYNLSTPKNGEPIISATQDFITAAYLLSSKDNFFDKKTFTNICMYMVDGNLKLDLPPPAILKPEARWTGKQVFSMLMRPNKDSPVQVNMDAKCRDFSSAPPSSVSASTREAVKKLFSHHGSNDMDSSDGWLVVRNSEVMCGLMDKTTVGSGKKDSIFYVILRDFGPDEAVTAMNRLAKLSARWLTNQGFSIGINDVYPTQSLEVYKSKLVNKAYAQVENFVQLYKENKLKKATGMDLEATLESKISGELNAVRKLAGEACTRSLSKYNSPLVMAKSGSKGSDINVAQMVALVGQQIIGGARVPNGFQDRSLPHFTKNSVAPPAKGFVKNSFFSGLRPTEFLMHAMSGREGLVDTAVKTAETGYMSRRLMKSLEDLSVQYDNTVRNSSNIVVQFLFGADNLDPVDMEGNAVPVNFQRTWNHAEALTYDNTETSLSPKQIENKCKEQLAKRVEELQRHGLVNGEVLDYELPDDKLLDEKLVADRILKKKLENAERPESALSKDEKVLLRQESRMEARLEVRPLNHKLTHGADLKEGERKFIHSVSEHVQGKINKLKKALEDARFAEDQTFTPIGGKRLNNKTLMKNPPTEEQLRLLHVEQAAKVSLRTLTMFISLCLEKYRKALSEPGHAVGAVGAQSIGEPGTQMTLKTFHFAGVAGMSITQGVPRIKEIINASKAISTPVIVCPLEHGGTSWPAAHVVQARIQKTHLQEVLLCVEDMWSATDAHIALRVDLATLSESHLGITTKDIAKAIVANKKLKIIGTDVTCTENVIYVRVSYGYDGKSGRGSGPKAKVSVDEGSSDILLRVNHLKRAIPALQIAGLPEATRAIIQNDGTDKQPKCTVNVEGYGLRACMNTTGVIGTKCSSNSIMEMREVLGVEAARTTIAKEIAAVMSGMDIDPRHMELLADVMTYKGEVLGITRFGLSKMRDSVLQLASFEKTPDHLFEASAGMKTDRIEGVSECIIMGQTMGVGTGAVQMVMDLDLTTNQIKPKPTLFEEAWKEECKARRKEANALYGKNGANGVMAY